MLQATDAADRRSLVIETSSRAKNNKIGDHAAGQSGAPPSTKPA
jgi:hypothetical protein